MDHVGINIGHLTSYNQERYSLWWSVVWGIKCTVWLDLATGSCRRVSRKGGGGQDDLLIGTMVEKHGVLGGCLNEESRGSVCPRLVTNLRANS